MKKESNFLREFYMFLTLSNNFAAEICQRYPKVNF